MIREGKEHDLSISSDSTHVTLYGLLRANNLHSGDNFQWVATVTDFYKGLCCSLGELVGLEFL